MREKVIPTVCCAFCKAIWRDEVRGKEDSVPKRKEEKREKKGRKTNRKKERKRRRINGKRKRKRVG